MNTKRIQQRFSEIQAALAEVRRLASVDDAEFWKKKEYIAAVKYQLLLAIEALGSVCVHIAAKEYGVGISAFGECFEALEKEGFLDKKLSICLRKMVRFRNKLIHQYWDVDDFAILEYARTDLGDFEAFMKAVKKKLEEKSSSAPTAYTSG